MVFTKKPGLTAHGDKAGPKVARSQVICERGVFGGCRIAARRLD
jgi:hypothetical protein